MSNWWKLHESLVAEQTQTTPSQVPATSAAKITSVTTGQGMDRKGKLRVVSNQFYGAALPIITQASYTEANVNLDQVELKLNIC